MSKTDIEELRQRLLAMLKRDALRKGNFVLSSGKTSTYYLDGRVITLTPEGAYLAASIIVEKLKGSDISAIGGPTLGADPIVGAVAALSHQAGLKVTAFIVRKAAKEHGTMRQIEGPALKPGCKVLLVDDVATTGKALIEAKQAMDKAGIIAQKALVIVDREEGAAEALAKCGLQLDSIFKIKDLDV